MNFFIVKNQPTIKILLFPPPVEHRYHFPTESIFPTLTSLNFPEFLNKGIELPTFDGVLEFQNLSLKLYRVIIII